MYEAISKTLTASFIKVSNLTSTEHLIAMIIGCINFVVGDWTTSMTLLIVLQVIDVLTGLKKGKRSKNISSSALKKGARSKFGGWLYIVVGNAIDISMEATGVGLARTVVISYLTLMELISITENAQELGAYEPPKFLTEYLAVTKDKISGSSIIKDKD